MILSMVRPLCRHIPAAARPAAAQQAIVLDRSLDGVYSGSYSIVLFDRLRNLLFGGDS